MTNYFKNHREMREDVFRKVPSHGLLLEFGVNLGRSANFFSDLLDKNGDARKYFGFDTFTGLTEHWGGMARAGTFNRDGVPPDLNKRVSLVIGDILETFVPFLSNNDEKIAFIHVDTDTYTPCAHVLNHSRSRLMNGSIILFDEF